MKKIILFVFIVIFLIAGIVFIVKLKTIMSMMGVKATTSRFHDPEKKIDRSNNRTAGKFKGSKYEPIAYEIAPVKQISSEAKIALFGIAIKRNYLSDGSVEVLLRPNNPQYPWKKFVIKPGYTLYFTDTTDDDEENGLTDTDANSNGDDFPILVDPQGNIAPGQNLPNL